MDAHRLCAAGQYITLAHHASEREAEASGKGGIGTGDAYEVRVVGKVVHGNGKNRGERSEGVHARLFVAHQGNYRKGIGHRRSDA